MLDSWAVVVSDPRSLWWLEVTVISHSQCCHLQHSDLRLVSKFWSDTVCWSLVQLTLGELIHKVVGDLLELGCIDGEKFLETLNFIDEILVGGVVERSYRHGQLKQGLAHAVPGPLG